MMPLTVEDLLPLEEYAPRRGEFFDSHRRYIDRCRRVRLGNRLTLIFENRKTLWFRVQEMVRITRLSDPRDLAQELNLYNRLLPGRDLLQAALLLEYTSEAQRGREHKQWQDLQGSHLGFHIGPEVLAANLLTTRPEDRSIGTAHWVQFSFTPWLRSLLADFERPAWFAFDNGHYQFQSAPLGTELRKSLLTDLAEADE
jgi:hypothetical protein